MTPLVCHNDQYSKIMRMSLMWVVKEDVASFQQNAYELITLRPSNVYFFIIQKKLRPDVVNLRKY